jgi:hypothetical protein
MTTMLRRQGDIAFYFMPSAGPHCRYGVSCSLILYNFNIKILGELVGNLIIIPETGLKN